MDSGKSYILTLVHDLFQKEVSKLKEEYQHEYQMPVFVDPYNDYVTDKACDFLKAEKGAAITTQVIDLEKAVSKLIITLDVDPLTIQNHVDGVLIACGRDPVMMGTRGPFRANNEYEYIFIEKHNISEYCSLFQSKSERLIKPKKRGPKKREQ